MSREERKGSPNHLLNCYVYRTPFSLLSCHHTTEPNVGREEARQGRLWDTRQLFLTCLALIEGLVPVDFVYRCQICVRYVCCSQCFFVTLISWAACTVVTTHFGSYLQVFSPEHPKYLRTGGNQCREWIGHPQNRGVPCF